MRVVVSIIILAARGIVGAAALLCVKQLGRNRIDAPTTPLDVRVCHVYLLCIEHPTETPLTNENTIFLARMSKICTQIHSSLYSEWLGFTHKYIVFYSPNSLGAGVFEE